MVNLNPFNWEEGTITIDRDALGVDSARPLEMHDLITDATYTWHGGRGVRPPRPGGASPHLPGPQLVVPIEKDPLWYKTAVFYELYVRSFYDSNADGYGDFKGLTEKLDHLEWLGVDCLWLLPFYQSPLQDGGYDISDFYSILPGVRELQRLHGVPRGGAYPRDASG